MQLLEEKGNGKRRAKMKTKLTAAIVILLVISNVYFMNEAKKPDYKIHIGIPVSAEDGSAGFDFSESKPLKKETASDVMLSLLSAHTVEAPEMEERFPDAVLSVSDWKKNKEHYLFTFWLEENSVIFKSESEKGTEYREIDNLYYVTELEKIIKTEIEF